MENLTQELIEKAKQAKSAEEILALAKENGIKMTEEEAKAYYAQLHPVSGEIADDELENVAGGGCKSSSGRTVVTSGCPCFNGCFQSILRDGHNNWDNYNDAVRHDNSALRVIWFDHSSVNTCGSCRFLEFEGATGVCGKS